jgi:hypothetical protein
MISIRKDLEDFFFEFFQNKYQSSMDEMFIDDFEFLYNHLSDTSTEIDSILNNRIYG